MGKYMANMPASDVTEFLLGVAKRTPQKIIKLYTSEDSALRLLFVDAKDKNVITRKNGIYMFGDDIILGATDDAVITWMLDKTNKKVVDLMKEQTYPELYKKKKETK